MVCVLLGFVKEMRMLGDIDDALLIYH